MSFEVEVKYRAVDHDHLVQRLVQMGAVAGEAVDHEDTYLNHPARDFAQTGEAFRIRRLGQENRITYKGPRRSGPTKTREEIEIAVAEGLGPFAEIEALASGEADLPAAQQAVLTLAGTLGLTEVEPRSYLRMVLENQAAVSG